MSSVLPATYEDHHHQHFEAHGYVSLGQLVTEENLAALRERIDALMLGEIKTEGITFQLDGENGEYGSISGRTVGPSEKTLAYRRIDELHRSYSVKMHFDLGRPPSLGLSATVTRDATLPREEFNDRRHPHPSIRSLPRGRSSLAGAR